MIHPRATSSLVLRGFTLVEMLTTVAALVILLGMMVSLARDVRRRSATELTNDLLVRLDALMEQYMAKNAAKGPAVTPPLAPGTPDEQALRDAAWKNNEEFVKALRSAGIAPPGSESESYLLDAWGAPVVFMDKMHPAIGMAPQDRYFFFSAGPDGKYLTKEDNLYSYDRVLNNNAAARPNAPSRQP